MPWSHDPRLLCVEPEPAVRAAIAGALLAKGFQVDTAGSGAEGLALLRAAPYDLVLGRARRGGLDRAWLERAARAGVLGRALSLLLGAEHPPRDFDLPLLVAQVQTLLAAPERQDLGAGGPGLEQSEEPPPLHAEPPPPVQLTLYVSTHSPSSLRAQRRLAGLINRFPAGHVALTVRDLARDPRSAQDEDRVVFTPTLVRKLPLPKVWVIGDLDDSQLILDLLTTAGVEPSP